MMPILANEKLALNTVMSIRDVSHWLQNPETGFSISLATLATGNMVQVDSLNHGEMV